MPICKFFCLYRTVLFVVVVLLVAIQEASPDIWLKIEATQPLVVEDNKPELHAFIPEKFIDFLLQATPSRYYQKGEAMGFNFHSIARKIKEAQLSSTFEYMSMGTLLRVKKEEQNRIGTSDTIIIKLGRSFGMKFQLKAVSNIIQIITSQLSDFKEKENEIKELLHLAKSLPPGEYFLATDGHQHFSIELR
jgi:hypothetical protein